MLHRLILALFPLLLTGCISDTPKFDRISNAFTQFALQFGASHVRTTGGNDGHQSCADVHIDKYENIICGGYTAGNFTEPVNGLFDGVIVKLDSNGNILWTRQMGTLTEAPGGDNSGSDFCQGVTSDGDGNIYCVGQTSGSMGSANAGLDDVFLAKFSSSGDLLWIRQWGTAGYDRANDLIQINGYLYLTGETEGNLSGLGLQSDNDGFLMKVSTDGQTDWIKQIGFGAGDTSFCNDLTFDFQGHIVCAGGRYLTASPTLGKLLFWKVSLSGVERWSKTIDAGSSNEFCNAVTADTTGKIYCTGVAVGDLVVGEGTASQDIFAIEVKSNGDTGWMSQIGNLTLPGLTGFAEFPQGIIVGRDGNLIIGGSTRGDLNEVNAGVAVGQRDWDVVSLRMNRNDGSLLSIKQFGEDSRVVTGGETARPDIVFGIAEDPLGNIIFAGYTNSGLIETNAGPTTSDHDIFIFRTDANGNR